MSRWDRVRTIVLPVVVIWSVALLCLCVLDFALYGRFLFSLAYR